MDLAGYSIAVDSGKLSLVTYSVKSSNALLVLISWLLNLTLARPVRPSLAVKTYRPVAVTSFKRCALQSYVGGAGKEDAQQKQGVRRSLY